VAVLAVLAVVRDDEKRPAGSDAGGAGAHYPPPLIGRDPEVEDQHEIEHAGLRPTIEQVGSDPLNRHIPLAREPSRLVERDLREVDSGHLPSAFREPDGVAALAAGEVESSGGGRLAACATRKRLGLPSRRTRYRRSGDPRRGRRSALRSGRCGSFDDRGQSPAHLASGLGERVVGDDREHLPGVHSGDVGLAVLRVDDDVAGRATASVKPSGVMALNV
jgi:hypothetical protein